MRKIKNKNTKPELFVRKALHKRGFRYTLSNNRLPGKPDIVFPKFKVVVLVHGCFWHRHNCRKGQSVPSTNREMWLKKFENNVIRDATVIKELEELDYKVITVWECEIRKNLEKVIGNIEMTLRNRS